MRKSIKRVAAFTLATVLAVSTLAIGGDIKTVDAASASVNVITAEKNNYGDSIKYTYNKKGLVAKVVSKNSYKTSDEDVTETITTTYKYNKKNKVAKKTTKSVTKTKYYETDKTTGMKIVGTKGTVTYTATTVTTYKYNKKGLATSSVATTTYGMSGSTTKTDKSLFVEGSYNDNKELSDGRVIAGYNDYKADGTEYSDTEKAQSAYYYAGNLALTEGTEVTTTSYANKGNGIYTETTTTTRNSGGYNLEPVKTYYERYNGSVVAVTKDDNGYKRPDGTYAEGSVFSRTEQVNIVQDPTGKNTSTNVCTKEINEKSVTTTTYTYDKKKRVKKAVATTVYSDNESDSDSHSASSSSTKVDNDYSSYSKTIVSSSKSDSANKSESTYEGTSVRTTTYTYDKKGRAKKTVSTNDGKENSKKVKSSMTVSENSESSRETTTTYKDGTAPSKSTYTEKSSNSYSTYPTTTTRTVVNGVQTTTVTSNPYTETYAESSSNSTPSYSRSSSSTGTKDYVTYANGGSKITNTYTNSYSYNDINYPEDSYSDAAAGTEISYRFDEKGSTTGYVNTYKYTNANGTTSEGADAEYRALGESFSGVLATQKIDAAKAALEASGSPFSKSTTKTVLATPSKATKTYSYDKNGNVKAANTKGTYTDIVYVQNETYGNYIYEFDANGQLQTKQTAVTHSYTSKDTNENTVKNGTNSLTKVLSMNKYAEDRSKSNGYRLSGRVTYTIKKKKSSAAKLAKKQQWILQNGRLNGEIGLD